MNEWNILTDYRQTLNAYRKQGLPDKIAILNTRKDFIRAYETELLHQFVPNKAALTLDELLDKVLSKGLKQEAEYDAERKKEQIMWARMEEAAERYEDSHRVMYLGGDMKDNM